jgi:hypothetical protein
VGLFGDECYRVGSFKPHLNTLVRVAGNQMINPGFYRKKDASPTFTRIIVYIIVHPMSNLVAGSQGQ